MTAQAITPRQDSGKTYIRDQKIYWDFNGNNLLEIEIASICAIGEYTTVHALHRNEWFIVFVLSSTESLQVSMYADGMQKVLTELSLLFCTEIMGKLALETDFKSNVLFPSSLAGKELYELKVIESKTWFDRFRARLGFGYPVELVLRPEVSELI
ncbi:MAG TPA: hypothetical protein VGE24_14600 [Emticicia sp.]